MTDHLPWLTAGLALVIALASVGIQWGIFSARLDALDKDHDRIQGNADRIPSVEAQMKGHDVRICALKERVEYLCEQVDQLRKRKDSA